MGRTFDDFGGFLEPSGAKLVASCVVDGDFVDGQVGGKLMAPERAKMGISSSTWEPKSTKNRC